jgi:hypothetical protein
LEHGVELIPGCLPVEEKNHDGSHREDLINH